MVRRDFPEVTLHTLPTNTGGAGGFAAGLAFALADGADLVWLMDDDTVPHRPPSLSLWPPTKVFRAAGRPPLPVACFGLMVAIIR